MRREVEAVRDLSRALVEREALIELLAELETIRLEAMVRLCAPASQTQPDQLLDVTEAANRMHVSKDFLYRHHKRYKFARREGRKLLFSGAGLDQYLKHKSR